MNNRPEEAHWLTDDEKRALRERLQAGRQAKGAASHAAWTAAVRDSSVWRVAIRCFCSASGFTGLTILWRP